MTQIRDIYHNKHDSNCKQKTEKKFGLKDKFNYRKHFSLM